MKIFGRIISIRKHKTSIFIDIFSNRSKVEQCFLAQDEKGLCIGDIIYSADFYEGTSKKGYPTIFINTLQVVGKSGKSITKKGLVSYARTHHVKSQQESLLGGNSLKIALARTHIYQTTVNFLNSKKFIQVFSDNIEDYRGAYSLRPFQLYNKELDKQQYLRITLECQLKKQLCFFLQPVYELGKVYRNMGSSSDHIQEYTVLEAVLPFSSLEDLYSILYELSLALYSVANTYMDISEMIHITEKPELITYENLMQGVSDSAYNEKKKTLKNHIVYNIPPKSPLAKWNDKFALEFEWIFNGSGLAHGYEDEYDCDVLRERFQKQIDELAKNGINAEIDESFLDTIEFGMPNSSSFVLGIDRLIQQLFSLPNISNVTNSLGV